MTASEMTYIVSSGALNSTHYHYHCYIEINQTFLVLSDAEFDELRYVWQISGFNIHSLRFHPGPLGHREICVKFRDMTDYVRVDVIPGPPTKLMLPGWDVNRVR